MVMRDQCFAQRRAMSRPRIVSCHGLVGALQNNDIAFSSERLHDGSFREEGEKH